MVPPHKGHKVMSMLKTRLSRRIGVINRIFQETAKYRKSIVIADVEPLNADDEKGSQADKSLGSCLTANQTALRRTFLGYGYQTFVHGARSR